MLMLVRCIHRRIACQIRWAARITIAARNRLLGLAFLISTGGFTWTVASGTTWVSKPRQDHCPWCAWTVLTCLILPLGPTASRQATSKFEKGGGNFCCLELSRGPTRTEAWLRSYLVPTTGSALFGILECEMHPGLNAAFAARTLLSCGMCSAQLLS